MAVGDRDISQLCTVDMLNVGQLPYGLVDHPFLVVAGLGYATLTLAVSHSVVTRGCVRGPRCRGGRLLMLLEVEAGCGRVFLGLTSNYSSSNAAIGIGQMPLVVLAGGLVWVLRAPLHMQGVFTYEFHVPGNILRIVARGHNAADILLISGSSRLACHLLVSRDSSPNA